MFRPALLVALLIGCAAPAAGQSAADHEALRKLKADALAAVNARDYPLAEKLLHKPFMATVVTQDSFTDFAKFRAYFEGLYSRDFLRIKAIRLDAEADELSTFIEGPVALTRGGTKERYDMADGRSFEMAGRWTAVSARQNGEWKLVAIHTGTNFLDNPVINAIEKSILWFGAGGLFAGLLFGGLGGWLIGRRKAG